MRWQSGTRRSLSVLLLVAAWQRAAHAQQYPLPTAAQQLDVDKDTARHFGDAPADPGPIATGLSAALTAHDIDKATRMVADWQLARSQPYFDRIWTWSVLYSGLIAASDSTGDAKYRDAVAAMAAKYNWELRNRLPNADDQSLGQSYLELYLDAGRNADPKTIAPTRADLDSVIGLKTLNANDPRIPWWWCDALFMAPPTWARMYAATGDHKYIDYLNAQWQQTYDLLYDQQEHLYARDATYISKRTANGKKIFWSRGEGWVMAGLVRTLQFLPPDDPHRPFYLQQLREMSARMVEMQGSDGLWRASLLDPEDYPLPEVSGSALIVYAVARGVNEGYLDASVYTPVIEKAWRGMLQHVYADGRLGDIQQTGPEPSLYLPGSSYTYGVGAYLLAASELKRMALHAPLITASAQAVIQSATQSAKDTRSAANRPTPDEIKNPPASWIDKDTGHRVVRLTSEPGSASFYFNVNAYTPDGNEMIYTTPAGISVLNLRTLQTRHVVEGNVRAIVAGHKTQSVFYIKPEENELYVTNVDTGVTRKLGKVPPRGNIDTINADETLAAGTYDEVDAPDKQYDAQPAPGHAAQTIALDQPLNKGQMMERRLAARIPLVLYTLNLNTGKITPLLHSTDWVNHLLFSPSDPGLLMYCHEGPWQAVDRIWTIRTDGTHNQLMHRRRMAMEIAGHEFWNWDGSTIFYDLQTPRGQDFFLSAVNVKDGERTWYHLERNEWSIHFNVSKDGSLFAGDGGDPGQVAKAPDGEWIELFHPERIRNTGLAGKDIVNAGVLHSEHLVNMSKHNYTLEPNVSFTPDGKWVIFRSNMFGPTYVFAVEVAKSANP